MGVGTPKSFTSTIDPQRVVTGPQIDAKSPHLPAPKSECRCEGMESSPEEAEYIELIEAIEAYEKSAGRTGKIPGGKG